jgi:competence protein ComFC
MRHFLSSLKDWCSHFLFPKKQEVLSLESLSASALLDILPPAENPKDRESIALFDYSHHLVKTIIWEIKYGGNVKLANTCGEILYDVIFQELTDSQYFYKESKPILIPIPVSDKRRFERGWNQSELLAKGFKLCDNAQTFKYLPRQLAKLRHTESQTKTISRRERMENLKDSMQILNPLSVVGGYIIVLDDVTTTGATFLEAKRALKNAGAKKVLCVALAH